MRASSPADRRAAHSCIALATMLLASLPLAAQVTVNRDADLLAAPAGRAVATVRKGATVVTAAANGPYVQASVDGWLAAALLGAARDSFALTVKIGGGARLRADPDPKAPVVADLRAGMGINEIERRGAWVHVRRGGWIVAKAVAPVGAPAPAPAAVATAPAPQPAPPAADSSRNGLVLTPVAATSLLASPDGQKVGDALPGARAIVTGRDRGWVRVRMEAWVREADLSVADTALRGALSAADLRADPDGTAGRIVHWDVEILAHQTADALRKGLSLQEPYLLAQGPAGENALLYLAIPPAVAAAAREIPDLARATVTARVRTGRSEPVGIPVLDLLTIVRR